MSHRFIILSLIGAVLVLGGAAVWLFLNYRPAPPANINITNTAPPPADNIGNKAVNGGDNILSNSNNLPTSSLDSETQVMAVARLFAESYGTYSSDADFANLKNLDYLLTSEMKADIAAIIEQGFSFPAAPPPFYAVTTRAVVVTIDSLTATRAELTLTTQRQEVFSRSGEPILRYQDIKVSLVKVKSEWLVSEANWVQGIQ